MTEDISQRIKTGNRAYYINKTLMTSKLISKETKNKLYMTIRPTVTYGCENWTLSVRDVHHLLVLERQILRRIYGPVQTEEGWKIKNNDEFQKFMRGADIVKYIRAQRIKWWGHLNGMEKTKTVRKIMEWNPIGMRSKGHPKNRWKDDVLKDLNKLKVKNWTYVIKDRKAWYELVQKTKTHKGCSVSRRRRRRRRIICRVTNNTFPGAIKKTSFNKILPPSPHNHKISDISKKLTMT
jgi:hypothetical protein